MEKRSEMSRNGCYDSEFCRKKDCRSCGGKRPFSKLINGKSKEFYRRLERRQDSTLGRMLLDFYNHRDHQPVAEEA